MSTEAKPFLTPQKYLELDSQAERPSEYLNGVMVEVEAATPKHGRILTNLIYSMTDVLRKSSLDYTVFSQSLRIFIPAAGLYAYPDIIVTWGKEEYGPFDTLLNPVLIIEVLSPSTETYDMGKKFEYYRSIPSLQRYITVAQDPVNISVWAVINEKWTLDATHVELHESWNFHGRLISLSDIYLGVLAVQKKKDENKNGN